MTVKERASSAGGVGSHDAVHASERSLREFSLSGARGFHRRLILKAAFERADTARGFARRTGIDKQGCTARCAELQRDGLLRECGVTVNEETGKHARVLMPTDKAREYILGRWRPPARTRATRSQLEDVARAAREYFQHPGLGQLARAHEALEGLGELDEITEKEQEDGS